MTFINIVLGLGIFALGVSGHSILLHNVTLILIGAIFLGREISSIGRGSFKARAMEWRKLSNDEQKPHPNTKPSISFEEFYGVGSAMRDIRFPSFLAGYKQCLLDLKAEHEEEEAKEKDGKETPAA